MILKLLAKLGLDKSGFDAGMDAATKRGQKFGGDLKTYLAGGFTAAAMATAGRALIDYAGKIKDTSEALGISTDAAQEFFEAAKLGGADLSEVANGMNRLQKAMSGAIGGDDKLLSTFSRLGVSAQQLSQLRVDEVFRQVSLAVGDTAVSGQTLTDIMEVLGRSGGRLIPVMRELKNLGPAGFKPQDIQAFEEAGDAIERLKLRMTQFVGGSIIGIGILARHIAKLPKGLFGGGLDQKDVNWIRFGSRGKPAAGVDPGALAAAEKARADREAGDETARGAHIATQDRMLSKEAQANEIFDRLRVRKLSTEERMKELAAERLILEKEIADAAANFPGVWIERDSDIMLRMAQIAEEMDSLQSQKGKVTGGNFQVNETSFGRIGAFTGEAARAAAPPGTREQLSALNEIKQALVQKGIIIRDVKR